MKALGVDHLPPRDRQVWYGEIKFDGYRAIAVLNRGEVQLWSRNHKPLEYPEITARLQALPCDNAVLDGEIVALDEKGRSSFQALQGRDIGQRPPIVYFLFDLLHLDGRSLLAETIEVRRAALERLFRRGGREVQLSEMFKVEPAELFAAARKQGLEGIILKRAGSLYESDRRSGAWLKIKNVNEQEFVIGGYTHPRASRQYFGALLIGYYRKGELWYAGKVGTGFDAAGLRELHERFAPLVTPECPFANLPMTRRPRFGQGMTRAAMRDVVWLRPVLVAQLKFAEWTNDGILRQPVFLGLRSDKAAKKVKREAGAV